MTSLCDIENDLKKKLKKKRFRHTIGVQYTSICLAMRYGEDLNKASYAGLLHDCAKNMGAESVVTACPLCRYNLEKNGGGALPVIYLTELLAEALGVKEDA